MFTMSLTWKNLLQTGFVEILFDGTLGKWEGKPYHIDLRDNVTPFHAKPFSIPKMYEHT